MPMESSKVPWPPTAPTPVRKPNRGTPTLFKGIFLLLGVSIIFSTPWSLFRTREASNIPFSTLNDPASGWQDNILPYREQTPWDISTDFPYPRVLEYDVQEGTWLRLDVHPQTGDIIFDMVGDLYCIAGTDVRKADGGIATARPILLGIPHDTDPRFSPEGDRVAFRSDAELGVENLWVMKWTGCEGMDLRPSSGGASRLQAALSQKDQDEVLLTSGIKETAMRKTNRLIREGRHGAQRVSNETFRYVSGPRFHPSGSKVIATKWYTSTITIGTPEGWEYPVPSLSDLGAPAKPESIKPGSGSRVMGKTLPPGKTVDDYADQHVGPEQFVWRGDDCLIYARNIRDTYVYSAEGNDVHKGVSSVFSHNLTTGKEETLVDAFPGGASRPELSRDGRTLAFVRRQRDHEILVLKDLHTGTIHQVWDGLTYDAPGISTTMTTYPSFAFSPSDDAVIIWASGQIHSVPISSNGLGERIGNGTPRPIRFTAHIEKRLAETLTGGIDLVGIETQDTQRVHALKELRVDEAGSKAVFQAAGVTVVQIFGEKSATKVPVVDENAPYYAPTFVPGEGSLVVHARWSDTNFTTFELADLDTGIAHELTNIPLGRYFTPTISKETEGTRRIAFVKTDGDVLTGNVVATAGAGLYVGEFTLPSRDARRTEKISIRNLRFIPSDIVTQGRVVMKFLQPSSKILVEQADRAFIVDFSASPDASGDFPRHTLASGRVSNEITVTLMGDGTDAHAKKIAFVEYQHIYLVEGTNVEHGKAVWARPGNETVGLTRLSVHGGHDLTWSENGDTLFWLYGPAIHSIELSKLKQCTSAIEDDVLTFGISCVADLVEEQEIFVEHSTDIARLRRDAKLISRSQAKEPLLAADNDVVVIVNATLLTMDSGDERRDLIAGGLMVVRAGVIEYVGPFDNATVPPGATVINAGGGFVTPGFIDVHAHWSGYTTRYPAKSWEMETFLAYGVTTLHNPSSETVNTHVERSRLESGQFIGPRILTTGTVIFAGSWVGLHEEIVDDAQAYSALKRIKAEAGPVSLSYKNYQLPSRASRQRLLLAGRNLSLLCVPEGGGNFDWDLTYIVDGMTTVEHSLTIPTLYDDVLTLWASSGTGATPTHVVSYGGPWGEQLVWATEDIPNNPKLRNFLRHDLLEGLTESHARPANSYSITNTSISVAKMVRKGLRAHIGAHGEPPMGLNYHAEMAFTHDGGLTNYEVLQAATSSAALTLGLISSIGTLAPGKLADFLVYPPDVDLLSEIKNTRDIRYVARGGRIWESSTMKQVWPLKADRQTMPPFNSD